MTIEELGSECPTWLSSAKTYHADVEMDAPGSITWRGGAFLAGTFGGGKFLDGVFEGGRFHKGEFCGGEFLGGEFWGDKFLGGKFLGGEFWGGKFCGGKFLGGEFCRGEFEGGEFWGDIFRGGLFLGGEFLGGTFCGDKFSGEVVVRGARKVVRIEPDRILTLTNVDGWEKTLCAVDGVAWIKAGPHLFTLAEAYRHWENRQDRKVTYAMLDGIAAVARSWGLRAE